MLNRKGGGTKCAACETEQPGNEGKLDVSVSADGSEALAYYRIGAVVFKFGGLGLQGHGLRSDQGGIFTIPVGLQAAPLPTNHAFSRATASPISVIP